MKELYVAWQDPEKRHWLPVGRLTVDKGRYRFEYTKGASKSQGFIPFGRMTDLETIYESEELFPLFANRLLSKSRPEYKSYLKWLNVEEKETENNPFMILSLTEGLRGTDSLEVFPCPELNNDGKYEVRFFSHGVRYLPKDSITRINKLSKGDKLFLIHDVQNEYDSLALALRTDDPKIIVGYCPRYLNDDFHQFLKRCDPNLIEVTVDQVNPDAPFQLRLLCKLTSIWPGDFRPCSSELYQSLARNLAEGP